MYCAYASVPDNDHHGSTKLHMDLTDAQNIMLFAAKFPADGKPGGADWDLFKPEDADAIREFLRAECGFQGPEDPIHSQTVYLTPEMLDVLWKKYGVKPYKITQYAKQSVCIPAGCAHQVRLHLYNTLVSC
jgi:hypothetical protein